MPVLLSCRRPLLALAVAAAACNGPAPAAQNTTSTRAREILADSVNGAASLPGNSIEAYVLAGCYRQNEVRADADFKGRDFFVTGIIQTVQKDPAGHIYIVLRTDEPLMQVHCYFDNAVTAAQLKPGMEAKLKGRCAGLAGDVVMEDCSLTETVAYD